MFGANELSLSCLQKGFIEILKCGPVPQHIGFIMDGNRRFSKKIGVSIGQAYSIGFDNLARMAQLCQKFGVKETTFYLFSTDNLQRSEKEVTQLLHLCFTRIQSLMDETEELNQLGVCVKIFGNLTNLPSYFQKVAKNVAKLSGNNRDFFINLAFGYTSTDEILHSARALSQDQTGEMSENLVSEALYSKFQVDPDLIVRTSGESRFSNFLLWQAGQSYICFRDTFWPSFGFWDLATCLFQFQKNCKVKL